MRATISNQLLVKFNACEFFIIAFYASFNAHNYFQQSNSRLSRHFMRATTYAFKVVFLFLGPLADKTYFVCLSVNVKLQC